jgi:AcrR family transcriptional regulator
MEIAQGERRPKRTRSDGERSRQAILRGATELATIKGLEGLSLGTLATHIGMSKSGLYAHFGSKQELQLATIDAAEEIFDREVAQPGLAAGDPLDQVVGLSDAFLSYVERRVFPGGCFFAAAAAEFDAREGGPVRARIQRFHTEWLAIVVELLRKAQAHGEIAANADPEQIAFEIDSLLLGANAAFLLFEDGAALERARRAVSDRLAVRSLEPGGAVRRGREGA